METSRGGAERYAFTPLLHTTHLLDHAIGDAHEAALKTARPTTPKYSFPKDTRTFPGLNQPRKCFDEGLVTFLVYHCFCPAQ